MNVNEKRFFCLYVCVLKEEVEYYFFFWRKLFVCGTREEDIVAVESECVLFC